MRPDPRLVPALALAVAVAALAACSGSPREASGKTLARDKGCLACHGSNGEGGTGPAWKGLYGSEVTLNDGRVVTVDDEYLRRSMLDPQADVPQGSVVTMPLNPTLTDADITALVDYIKSLSG